MISLPIENRLLHNNAKAIKTNLLALSCVGNTFPYLEEEFAGANLMEDFADYCFE